MDVLLAGVGTGSVVVATLLAIVLVSFTSFSIYIFILHRRYDHLPGPPRSSFFFGNLAEIRKKFESGGEMADLFLEWSIKYDRLYVMWFMGWRPVIVVSNPDTLREAIVKYNLPKPVSFYKQLSTLFGVRFMGEGLVTIPYHDVWKKKRRAIDPAFFRSHLKTLISAFNDSCTLFLKHLDQLADGQTKVSMADQFHRVTLDVIGKVAFDINLKTIEDDQTPFPAAVGKLLAGMMFRFRNPFHKFDPRTYKFQRETADALRLIRKTGKECIESRRAAIGRGEEMPNDILSTMMKLELQDMKTLDTEELLDDFVTFFIAGQETTANQISLLLMELGRHPDIIKKMRDEVDEVLGSRDYVEFDDLANLRYMGQVLKETLRLYPPVASVVRESRVSTVLNGHVIPAGARISLQIYSTHRHPDNWKDPEIFDPDRWDPENGGNIKSFSYLPFSLGPRNCIGQVFAQFEAKVLLARYLQKFRADLCEGESFTLEQKGTLRPKDGLMCYVTRR